MTSTTPERPKQRKKRSRIPALLRRHPFAKIESSGPFYGNKEEHPALAERFSHLDAHVQEPFDTVNMGALRLQRSHRRIRLLLILGALLTGVFGAVQAGYADMDWPSITLSIIAAATVAISGYERQAAPFEKMLRRRGKAEELRSLYFGYLTGSPSSEAALRKAVAEIRFGQETD